MDLAIWCTVLAAILAGMVFGNSMEPLDFEKLETLRLGSAILLLMSILALVMDWAKDQDEKAK